MDSVRCVSARPVSAPVRRSFFRRDEHSPARAVAILSVHMVTRVQVRACSSTTLADSECRATGAPNHRDCPPCVTRHPNEARDKWIGWTFETFVQKLSTGDWNAKSALKAMALRTEIHAAARRRTIREFGQGAGLLPQRRLPDRRLCGACLGSSCLFFPLSEIPPLSGAGTLRALLRHLRRYVLPTRT